MEFSNLTVPEIQRRFISNAFEVRTHPTQNKGSSYFFMPNSLLIYVNKTGPRGPYTNMV